jgi:indole-3-glycerol phosphate synthase
MTDRLLPILDRKRQHVSQRKTLLPLSEIQAELPSIDPPRGFLKALQRKKSAGAYGLIAEMKRASPSRGRIVEHFDAALFAQAYQAGGAACLSVLTDQPYFEGLDEDLIQARNAVSLPVLRKDFIVDAYQIDESRWLGADCILLIVAALDDAALQDFMARAHELGMDALIEVHDRVDLDRALKVGTPIIGINNRNLKSLEVDLQTSHELARSIPEDILVVSESGLSSPADLRSMAQSGISTFLIGDWLLRQGDLTQAVKRLLLDTDIELK